MSEIVNKESRSVVSFFKSLDRISESIQTLTNHRPPLGGEHYLTDEEVSTRLKSAEGLYRIGAQMGRLPISPSVEKPCTGNRIFRPCWKEITEKQLNKFCY